MTLKTSLDEKNLSQLPFIELNTPTALSNSQCIALKILNNGESELPEYKGSIFRYLTWSGGPIYTRCMKGEPPPFKGKVVQIYPLLGPKDCENSEGLKVRVFSLELLNTLEDLQKKQNISTNEQIHIEEMKQVVRFFLEKGGFQKEAGFSDFLNLITELKERADELSPIFNRYFDLLELQKKIAKKNPEESDSHWNKIRVMIRSKLFAKNLNEKGEHARNIGLNPFPPLPKQLQTITNLYPTITAINLLENEHRKAGKWIMTHVRMITFRELCQSIQTSCSQMSETILEWDNYYLLAIRGKSQEWMADIAYRFLPLEKMPTGILFFSHYSSGEDILDHLTKSNNFVVFDDGAYSGDQFHHYLFRLLLCLKKKDAFSEKKNIYFVFGHFPSHLHEKSDLIRQEIEKYNVNVKIISNLPTKNLHAFMEEENLDLSLRTKIGDLANPERPLLITEWKTPDYVSTSMFATEGYIGEFGKGEYDELNIPRNLSVKRLDGIGPITDIITPYSKNLS